MVVLITLFSGGGGLPFLCPAGCEIQKFFGGYAAFGSGLGPSLVAHRIADFCDFQKSVT
jgi:hypothetical protein